MIYNLKDMKHVDNDWENFFNLDEDEDKEYTEDEEKEILIEIEEFEKESSTKKGRPYRQDDWSDAEDVEYDDTFDDIFNYLQEDEEESKITPEEERLSKQLVTQLKIESLDDEFIDEDRIKLIKKKINAHIAANPHADIIDIAAKMISYRDKKIHKSEKEDDIQ
jgi:hypothetical protein